MRNKSITWVFIVLTGITAGMEIWGAVSATGPQTWTHLLVTYLPAPLVLGLATVFAGWLEHHFADRYAAGATGRMGTKTKSVWPILVGAVAVAAQMVGPSLADGRITQDEWIPVALTVVAALLGGGSVRQASNGKPYDIVPATVGGTTTSSAPATVVMDTESGSRTGSSTS